MLPWAAALGAVGEQHMPLLSYQPTTHHGHAVALFHKGPKADARPPQPHAFASHPFEFYKHPPLKAYRLNKLLYDSRHRPQMRQRLLVDAGKVAEEYGLPAEQLAALLETLAFRHNGTPEPGKDADAVVNVGAHPVGALMAVHVLQAEHRRAQKLAGVH
jgi:hypothetical protein